MKHATLALLVAFALGARVLFCLEVVGLHAPLRGDEVDYDRLAVSLDSGKGFVSDSGSPTASRPPLYPLLLAGIYRLAGQRPEAGRVAQIVLSTVIVLLVYALSKRFSSERVALSATALAALSPPLVFMSSYLLVENLYIALVLSFLILFSRGVERPASIAGCFIGGVVLGLSSLARPNALPVALFAAAA
jgi:4-amino-4-deoxy-L-arabinose transferase-like glycosyltransferase